MLRILTAGVLLSKKISSFEKRQYAVKSNAGTIAPTLLFAAYRRGKKRRY
jgi:hypothetical protein